MNSSSRPTIAAGAGPAAPGIANFDAKVMSKVSSNTKIEPLTNQEVAALLLCMLVVEPASERMSFKTNVAAPSNFWYKMPLLDVQTYGGAFSKEEGEDLRKIFKTEESLNKLGKIAAVDIFIGNSDRFDKVGNVSDLGNIFFARKKGLLRSSFTPIGLDFWDGFKEDMNLTLGSSRWELLAQNPHVTAKDVVNMKSDFLNWISTLTDPAKMQAFAQNTVESVNADLERAGVDSINTDKPKYKIAMAKGMGEGAEAIKKHVKAMVMKKGMGGVPPGALYRMQHLKWV